MHYNEVLEICSFIAKKSKYFYSNAIKWHNAIKSDIMEEDNKEEV